MVLTGSSPDNVQCFDTFTLEQKEDFWSRTYDTKELANGQYKVTALFEGYDYDMPGYVEMENIIFVYIENLPWWRQYLIYLAASALCLIAIIVIIVSRKKHKLIH